MNKVEARLVLSDCLARYRLLPYEELARRVSMGHPHAEEIAPPSGTKYQLEVQFFCDGKPNADVRVIASVDDGGIRALFPITESFIVSPDGRFVGE
jgi:hypothetical protein